MPGEYPCVVRGLFKNIYCYRLGPSLAYNAFQFGTTTRTREKIEEILPGLDKQKDIVLLSFGEIDCRAHMLKQCAQSGKTLLEVVASCVDNYWKLVAHIRSKGFRVVIWNAVYSANYLERDSSLEYPYFGTVEQRNEVTERFNQLLESKTHGTEVCFLDMTQYLLDKSGKMTNSEYYFDSIHLNHKLFLRTLRLLNSKMSAPVFSESQFFAYPFLLHMRKLTNHFRLFIDRWRKRIARVFSR